MNRPKISVVIPTYNCARWITDAVESALTQSLRPSEVIIIDDGSTDDTAERIARLSDPVVQYVRQKNAGVSCARNAGVARATGEFVAFLDADDVWHPRKLEFQHSVMRRLPDIGLLGTERFDWPKVTAEQATEGLEIDPARAPLWEIPWRDLVIKNFLATSAILVRRSVLSTFEPDVFDGDLRGPEDHDLWLRIAEKTKAARIELPLTGYRSHVDGLGNNTRAMEIGMARVLAKLGERGAWRGPRGRALKRRAMSFYFHSCATMHLLSGEPGTAVRREIASLIMYPLPIRTSRQDNPIRRLRLLAGAMRRLNPIRWEKTSARKRRLA